MVTGVLAVGQPPYPTPGLRGGLCDGCFGFARFARWKVCLADLCDFRVEFLCFDWTWKTCDTRTCGLRGCCDSLGCCRLTCRRSGRARMPKDVSEAPKIHRNNWSGPGRQSTPLFRAARNRMGTTGACLANSSSCTPRYSIPRSAPRAAGLKRSGFSVLVLGLGGNAMARLRMHI